MFVIRPAIQDDLATLLKFAKMVHFINLPADKDLLAAKIARSRKSFTMHAEDVHEREFMFVLQEHESDEVIGTCTVICSVSWKDHPHIYLNVRKREHYSLDLQGGQVHTTVEMCTDESGPSEVGGLILAPGFRGRPERLGSLLSLVRFHFIGLHRELFAPRILAELMGPLTPDAGSPLWEYFGRRFINLSYREADLFSSRSKEFMLSLFPKGEIYVSMLPPEARALIGRVGEETEPARKLLEKQGFRFFGHVDPFDGGPYLEAVRDEIPLVKATERLQFAGAKSFAATASDAFVSNPGPNGFRATRCAFEVTPEGVFLPEQVVAMLGLKVGATIGVTPLPASREASTRKKSRKSTP
ncbi:MAG: arginine N-succinyltransferase [Phycisphaerales bacterium]|nr:arginine N-succinyltransferase [Phycisphaerales bacterium]